MKKIYSIPAVVFLLVAIGACTESIEPDTLPQKGKAVSITATHASANPQTRVGYDFNGFNDDGTGTIAVTWSKGDKIYVGSKSPRAEFTLEGEGGSPTGTFVNDSYAGELNNQYAYYMGSDDKTVYFSNQVQAGNDNTGHLSEYNYMQGRIAGNSTNGYTIDFSPRTILIKFLLTLPNTYEETETLHSLTFAASNLYFANWINPNGYGLVNETKLSLNGVTPQEKKVVAYMMLSLATHNPSYTIPVGETLTVTLIGSRNMYTYTATVGASGLTYTLGEAYVAKIGATDWTTAPSPLTLTNETTPEAITPVDDTYTITNAAQLLWFRQQANDATSPNTFAGKTVKLATDITLAETTWTPINNNSSYAFAGTFDGDGHTIRGAMAASGDVWEFGFFGVVKGGTIQNLTVEADLTVTGLTVTGVRSIGKIAGYVFGTGAVTGCTASGHIDVEIAGGTSNVFIGGIAGRINSLSVNISGCTYTNGRISATGTTTYAYLGGIAGTNAGSIHTSHYQGTGIDPGDGKAGALVGWNYDGKVYDCCTPNTPSGGLDPIGYDITTLESCTEGHNTP